MAKNLFELGCEQTTLFEVRCPVSLGTEWVEIHKSEDDGSPGG